MTADPAPAPLVCPTPGCGHTLAQVVVDRGRLMLRFPGPPLPAETAGAGKSSAGHTAYLPWGFVDCGHCGRRVHWSGRRRLKAETTAVDIVPA